MAKRQRLHWEAGPPAFGAACDNRIKEADRLTRDPAAVTCQRCAGWCARADPINRWEWTFAGELDANDYNPNVVFTPELRLLERSIIRTGWVQPILACAVDRKIIDGFHRWKLAQESAELVCRYALMVPVALVDVEPWEAMLLTVRMNRAKGTHVAVKMHALVRKLIDVHHLDRQQVAEELGAELGEVDLLYQEGVFQARNLADAPYSRAWVPIEDGQRGAGG